MMLVLGRSCPEQLRTNSDQQGIPCGPDSRRSICPCEPLPVTNIPTLSQWGLITLVVVLGILGIVGFMVVRRRVTA